MKSFVCGAAVVGALFASTSLASACDVNVDLELYCGFHSMTDCSGVSIHDQGGDGYDCYDGYLSSNGGGTVTFEVDLPSGVFNVSGTPGPGDSAGPAPIVDINDGTTSICGSGIVGPTTVYVSFLNQGSAITRAAAISVTGCADPIPSEFCVDLGCGFHSTNDVCGNISIHDQGGDGYDCYEGYLSSNGGGTVTLEVDLGCGTYDVSATPGPGDSAGPAPIVDINDGTSTICATGIVGPTTVYVSFLNQGSAITRAAGVCVDRY